MKRMISAILVLVCLLALAPAASAAGSLSNFKRINTYENNFTDVPAASWYAESVSAAYEFGLMKGSAADKFNPDGSVTIAEALAMWKDSVRQKPLFHWQHSFGWSLKPVV